MNDINQCKPVTVGGGSAGAVLANRLSENPEWSVLLLEAGGPPTPESYMPAMVMLGGITRVDWGYNTVPQSYSMLGFKDHVSSMPPSNSTWTSLSMNSMNSMKSMNSRILFPTEFIARWAICNHTFLHYIAISNVCI